MQYWLLKSEPSTYSFTQLLKDGKTNWNGVRNFQARNFLQKVAVGDRALIYHSGDDKAVVGIAKVTKGAYPDPDPKKKGDWVQIDLAPDEALKTPVTLKTLKATASFKDLLLVRHSRLSCMPIDKKHYELILKMGSTS